MSSLPRHVDVETSGSIELGAEFVHGRAPELLALIEEASLDGGRRWYALA